MKVNSNLTFFSIFLATLLQLKIESGNFIIKKNQNLATKNTLKKNTKFSPI
jgi:hypothetical protein